MGVDRVINLSDGDVFTKEFGKFDMAKQDQSNCQKPRRQNKKEHQIRGWFWNQNATRNVKHISNRHADDFEQRMTMVTKT